MALGALGALGALSTAASCSSTTPPTGAAVPCQLNSDCEGSLICDFGRCHVACATSKDGSGGVTCLPPGVCQLSVESACSDTLPCVTGLTCADDTCRAACNPKDSNGSPGGCLGGQTCTTISKQVRNTGVITAYGLGYTAGGGAGGAILLEAPTIDVQGTLAANGAPGGGQGAIYGGSGDSPVVNPPGGNGSGGATVNGGPGSLGDAGPGGGGGGAGYIRLNAACPPNVGPSAIISPSLAPITACASLGTLKGQ